LQRPGQNAPGRRSPDGTRGRLLWRIRSTRGRESPRQGPLWALQPPQARGHLQMLGPRHALRVLDGCATRRPTPLDERTLVVQADNPRALRFLANTSGIQSVAAMVGQASAIRFRTASHRSARRAGTWLWKK